MKEIRLFNKALKMTDGTDCNQLAELALKKGYAVHPDCMNARVMAFLRSLPDNVNTTFYKEWKDITSKSRLELLLDQIMHYASTYGTNFAGVAYVPNGDPEEPQPLDLKDCKVILPITVQEIDEKIHNMFKSGIALEANTIVDCLELINELKINLNVDVIRNKEVMVRVCDATNVYPSKPEEFMRYLVYKHTGDTLLIKNPAMVHVIKHTAFDISKAVSVYGIDGLATVFHRFKPLLLAMRTSKTNKVIINKVRRAANRHHKPYTPSFWENILTACPPIEEVELNVNNLNNFKKIQLMQTIMRRDINTGTLPVLVRNGKLFVRSNYNSFSAQKTNDYHTELYITLYNSLIESLHSKACVVKLPKGITLALPTSEKSYIGNIPLGSFVDPGKQDVIVGIHWKGNEGARDIDLSLEDFQGTRIGWNARYNYGRHEKANVIYSGDQTSANPEATELMYAANGMPDSIVKANLYSGHSNEIRFHVFVAVQQMDTVPYNKMVEQKDIVFMTHMDFKGGQEKAIGTFINGKFYFMNITTGNRAVSRSSTWQTDYINHLTKTANCTLELGQVLIDSGFTIADENTPIDDIALDLSTFDKSDLISLLGA